MHHPDLLALEAVRAGEGTPQDLAHIESCESCRRQVQAMRALADRLVDAARVRVPPHIDRTILGPRKPLRLKAWMAIAAVLVAGFVTVLAWGGRHLPEDVNRDGAVDIIDAYALAVKLKTSASLKPAWDLNRDGQIDHQDVDAIARGSVSVGGAR